MQLLIEAAAGGHVLDPQVRQQRRRNRQRGQDGKGGEHQYAQIEHRCF
jgi:hypothetical protein